MCKLTKASMNSYFFIFSDEWFFNYSQLFFLLISLKYTYLGIGPMKSTKFLILIVLRKYLYFIRYYILFLIIVLGVLFSFILLF